MKIRKIMRAVISWMPNVVIFFCLGTALWAGIQTLLGAQLPFFFGWATAAVQTGSMEPVLPIGSLIVIRATGDYAPGDIVAYIDSNESVVTHRIISNSEGTIIAKGDANNAEDRPFRKERILGEVRFAIPGIGGLLMKVKQPVIIVILILGIIFLYLTSFIPQKKGTVQYE